MPYANAPLTEGCMQAWSGALLVQCCSLLWRSSWYGLAEGAMPATTWMRKSRSQKAQWKAMTAAHVSWPQSSSRALAIMDCSNCRAAYPEMGLLLKSRLSLCGAHQQQVANAELGT